MSETLPLAISNTFQKRWTPRPEFKRSDYGSTLVLCLAISRLALVLP